MKEFWFNILGILCILLGSGVAFVFPASPFFMMVAFFYLFIGFIFIKIHSNLVIEHCEYIVLKTLTEMKGGKNGTKYTTSKTRKHIR